jgi:diphthine-ammonia ligase
MQTNVPPEHGCDWPGATRDRGLKPRAAVSWSAGKDSCLAWLRATEQGLPVSTFVTMCEADGLSKSHALPPELIAAQVRAIGAEWRPVRVAPGTYAQTFDAELRRLRDEGHSHMVFGDIDLAAHRDWLEPACARAGLAAVFPLWSEPRRALAGEIIERGIRARLVCVDTRWLDASFCGADYDAALLARLPAGVCPCGEEGEFHTFVFDAPGFAHALPIANGTQRRVSSVPPLAPTEFVLQSLELGRGFVAAAGPSGRSLPTH